MASTSTTEIETDDFPSPTSKAIKGGFVLDEKRLWFDPKTRVLHCTQNNAVDPREYELKFYFLEAHGKSEILMVDVTARTGPDRRQISTMLLMRPVGPVKLTEERVTAWIDAVNRCASAPPQEEAPEPTVGEAVGLIKRMVKKALGKTVSEIDDSAESIERTVSRSKIEILNAQRARFGGSDRPATHREVEYNVFQAARAIKEEVSHNFRLTAFAIGLSVLAVWFFVALVSSSDTKKIIDNNKALAAGLTKANDELVKQRDEEFRRHADRLGEYIRECQSGEKPQYALGALLDEYQKEHEARLAELDKLRQTIVDKALNSNDQKPAQYPRY